MAVSIREQIENHKKELLDIKSKYDQAKGAYDTQLQQMKKKYGISDLNSGQKVLKEKKLDKDKMEDKLKKMVDRFEDEFSNLLGG